MNKTLIVLLGPTAVGKTDISIDIAQHLNCDIISADSRQFFREMKIGTARPSDDQLARVKHHFIAFLSVRDYYSSNRYEKDVLDLLSELFQNNNIALMSGGSAMYIDSVC
ncbi:MAG: tRNA (adenosine(37)-N6)-dimethylallyltransferase MiaA, partial [Bacteroidales bacterium]|nr:tRNA (adenosine(37)-N6)-dimethylallyltransferase MiaA [Bacteroidales bacterium]